MKTITTQELKSRLDQGPVALFDVRGDVDYERGHIAGAKTAPLGSLVFRVAGVMKPDSPVIVYCGGGGCTLAEQAASRLEDLGLRNVYCYTDGLQGWRSAGLAVIESPFAKKQTQGPVVDCRPLIIDRERAYGGAFMHSTENVESAGG